MKIFILGAGPTSLGAAWRLQELGHNDWDLLEAKEYPGGLSTSFTDPQGFTWDIGVHVQFSHYEYFDRLMIDLLGKEGWLQHPRTAWIWMRNSFIPYPLQNNLHRLPAEELEICLQGLREMLPLSTSPPANFREWVRSRFGEGIGEVFLYPYNSKIWAYPPEALNVNWVGERVATVDLEKVMQQIVSKQDAPNWGPNAMFQFPKHGGTGAVWKECARRLPSEKLHFESPVTRIHAEKKVVETRDGKIWNYDALITAIPIPELLKLTGDRQWDELVAKGLLHSTSYIYGIGMKGQPGKHLDGIGWIYFPEEKTPFYRVTVMSKQSPFVVPDHEKNWSLLVEASGSAEKPWVEEGAMERVIASLKENKLIQESDEIISRWSHVAAYGYPTPSLHREEALGKIIPYLEEQQIYSRGRFGGWKYEIGNQDHSVMQGVEAVNRLLRGEKEMTYFDPNLANSKKHPLKD